jgi:hypothetical protein
VDEEEKVPFSTSRDRVIDLADSTAFSNPINVT